MDLQKKLNLLIKYDFSAWIEGFSKFGFSGLLIGIFYSLYPFKYQLDDSETPFYSFYMDNNYQEIIKYYWEIDFDGL